MKSGYVLTGLTNNFTNTLHHVGYLCKALFFRLSSSTSTTITIYGCWR